MSETEASEALKAALAARTCEVCSGTPVIGIVCSLAGASSHAICQTCLDAEAEPWSNAVYLGTEDAGDWVNPIIDASIARSGKTREEYDQAVEELKRHFASMSEG